MLNYAGVFFYKIDLYNLCVIRSLQETEAQVNFEIQKQRYCIIATAQCYSIHR